MKCILLMLVFTTTVVLSRETKLAQEKRDVDLSQLVQDIQQVVSDLFDGSYTSEVIPTVTQIIEQAEALECEADDQDDQSQIDAILGRVVDAIQNHEKAATGDSELVCEALTAVRASGQTILDKLTNLGETFISFDLEDNLETSESGRSRRDFCIGASVGSLCVGLGWKRSVRGIRALLFTDD